MRFFFLLLRGENEETGKVFLALTLIRPMVYACAFCAKTREKDMAAIGFADSKSLTAAQREALFEKLKSSGFIGHIIRSLSPQDISASMLRR